MAGAVPLLLQGLSSLGPLAAAHPIAAGAALGGVNGARGGGLEGALKGAALGGLGSFAGGALGKVLGDVVGNVGTAATQPLAGGAGGAVGDSLGSAASSTLGAVEPGAIASGLSPAGASSLAGGASPIQSEAISVTAPGAASPGSLVGARIGSSAGAGLGTGINPSGIDRPADTSQPTEATKNNSNTAQDAAHQAGQQIVNQGLSALTAPKGISGAPSSSGGVVRPAAGGSGTGGLGGLSNAGSLKPSIYPWTQAA